MKKKLNNENGKEKYTFQKCNKYDDYSHFLISFILYIWKRRNFRKNYRKNRLLDKKYLKLYFMKNKIGYTIVHVVIMLLVLGEIAESFGRSIKGL